MPLYFLAYSKMKMSTLYLVARIVFSSYYYYY